MSKDHPTRRLFFALWPDAATRDKLLRIVRSLPRKRGRPVAAQNLHITLVFLGAVKESELGCLKEQASQVVGVPFKLSLTQLGYFSRPRVIWLGPANCPEPLSSLVAALNNGLQPCGFRPDARPFSAHVTLFRKAIPTTSNTKITPVEWSIDHFCLVESKTHPRGVDYNVLQYFSLEKGLSGSLSDLGDRSEGKTV